jgi:diaminopimelate decarboxylase
LASEIGLRCVGISFSIGIDCFCPSIFTEAVELSARLFRVGTAIGHQMSILNIGGGFASPSNDWQYSHFNEVFHRINFKFNLIFYSALFSHKSTIGHSWIF